jgi:hypothetical protein
MSQRLPRKLRRLLDGIALSLSIAACQAASPAPEPAQAAPQPAAEPPPVAQPVASQPAAAAPEQPAAVAAAEDEFGRLLAGMGVRYFPNDKHLEVSGWVNMQTGLVEVFACAPEGKTHESVIVLDCVPSGLQAGLLALGLEPGKPVEFGTGDQYTPPTGDGVLVEVHWTDLQGHEQTARAEDWITDEPHKRSMPRCAWIFAGSFLQPVSGTTNDVTFAADYVKSLVTTYHDASSILENPWTEGIDDTVYYSNDKAVPPVGTSLTAIFRPAK